MRYGWMIVALVLLPSPATSPAQAARARGDPRQVERLADAFVTARVQLDPGLAYTWDLPIAAHQHARLPDATASGRRRFDQIVDRLFARLARIDRNGLQGEARTLHAVLEEELVVSRALRICREEYWDISHYDGWLTGLPSLARRHPVGTPALRRAAIDRWRSLPDFVDHQILNLREGMAAGYSVPKLVVERAIQLADGLVSEAPEQSPFYSPAARDGDPRFAARMRELVADTIQPALRRYRDFLSREYLPAARESLGIADLPHGAECYRALLRRHTSLDRSPDEYFDAAEQDYSIALAEVLRLGEARYGVRDAAQAIRRARAETPERYDSAEQMLGEARAVVARAGTQLGALFRNLPSQEIRVESYPDFQRGLGLDARYDHSPDPARPAIYRLPVERFDRTPRSVNISISLHEGVPGHHLMFARLAGRPQHPLRRLSLPTAFNEGWAQYAESLAREMGLTPSDTGRIIISLGPRRMTLLELGIHGRGWDRDLAAAFFREREASAPMNQDRIERIAARPGQAMAYSVGEAEIRSLRAEAERALGSRFDVRDFHEAVLADGPVPLWLLRQNVEAWIARTRAAETTTAR